MRVEENITLFAGAAPANTALTEAKGTEQEKRETLFVGNAAQNNTIRDKIALRKEEARRQAMKLVEDAWKDRSAVDEDREVRRDHIKELQEDKTVLQQEMEGLADRQESLDKAYEAGEVGEADYFAEKAGLSQEEHVYQQKLAENQDEVMSENYVIRQTGLELLKDQSMSKAWGQADDVMEAAGEEVVSMALEAAKEHVDEEAEKREELAEKIEEKREEQEEVLEKREERKEAAAELAESTPVREMVSAEQLQDEIRQEIQSLTDKMKLIQEDIKGAVVDETL